MDYNNTEAFEFNIVALLGPVISLQLYVLIPMSSLDPDPFKMTQFVGKFIV